MNRRYIANALTLGLSLLLAIPASAQLLPGRSASVLGGDRPRPLPIEQAFPYFVSLVDSDTLDVTWQIAPDHYLYRHQFNFLLNYPDSAENLPLQFQLPDGKAKNDQFFGAIEAYYDSVTAVLSLDTASLPRGTSLIIQYQGCAEWGFCYPPQSAVYPIAP